MSRKAPSRRDWQIQHFLRENKKNAWAERRLNSSMICSNNNAQDKPSTHTNLMQKKSISRTDLWLCCKIGKMHLWAISKCFFSIVQEWGGVDFVNNECFNNDNDEGTRKSSNGERWSYFLCWVLLGFCSGFWQWLQSHCSLFLHQVACKFPY